MNETVKEVEVKQMKWIKESESREESMKKIMEEQKLDKGLFKQDVIKVIKEEKRLVRDTVDKRKCVVVFGIEEEKMVNKIEKIRKMKK